MEMTLGPKTPAGRGFAGEKEIASGDAPVYFPLSRSLAMVANCMFDVPS
jgi:hypothetical protein